MDKKHIILLLILFSTFLFAQKSTPIGLKVGVTAPEFMAKDQNDSIIFLKKYLHSGSVVLLFYRGEWCPVCNRQLKSLQDSLNLITNKGATVIAITPEKIEYVEKTIEKTKAPFHILSDSGSTIMNAYKVNYELKKTKLKLYKTFGINLEKNNGNNGVNLPVPAVYIINKDGKITYRYFDYDYKKRASVKEILNNL